MALLIGLPHRIKWEIWLQWSSWFLLNASLAVVLLCLLLMLIASPFSVRQLRREAALPSLDIEAVSRGPLGLDPKRPLAVLDEISQQLYLVAKNRRPDRPTEFWMKLGGKERILCHVGEPFYLEKEKKGEGIAWRLSSSPTPFPITLVSFDEERAIFDMGQGGKEQLSYPIPPPLRFVDHPAFQTLKEGELWGKDALFQLYGGKEYQDMALKQKLLFSDDQGKYACFVGTGDFLIWDRFHWLSVGKEGALQDTPVARVKMADRQRVEIDLWDETGFYQDAVVLNVAKSVKPPPKLDHLFSSVKQRPGGQISCFLQKRRIVLKPGDWLLHTSMGWHKLKSIHDIESYLHHRSIGELLIFQGAEKEQDKILLKGRLFDEMRTQSYDVSIPAVMEIKYKR